MSEHDLEKDLAKVRMVACEPGSAQLYGVDCPASKEQLKEEEFKNKKWQSERKNKKLGAIWVDNCFENIHEAKVTLALPSESKEDVPLKCRTWCSTS